MVNDLLRFEDKAYYNQWRKNYAHKLRLITFDFANFNNIDEIREYVHQQIKNLFIKNNITNIYDIITKKLSF